ncbi:MAG: ABC transporter substrate-binding protein [Spirulinaceae cyanobacterium]
MINSKRFRRVVTFLLIFNFVLFLNLITFACQKESSVSVVESPPENTVLNIWWDKGYVLEEDEAIQQVIKGWEQKSGQKADVSFYNADEIAQKANRADHSGKPPDVLFSSRAEYPLLAWEGILGDVSEVIEPVKDLYAPVALEAAYLYNKVEDKRSYYTVPLHQATIHIFYWQDLLAEAGFKLEDIPQDWDDFWAFWLQVQDKLRSLPGDKYQDVFGLGLPLSIAASDTYYLFEQILEAYDLKIMNESGELLVNQPEVRQGITNILKWYVQFYQQGYIPPQALQWLDPDNNRNFLNRVVVMTPNPTLSIPVALRQDRETYVNKIGILEFPLQPNGKAISHITAVRQAFIFAKGKNQKLAKDFLSYLIQPETIEEYLQASGGRYLPVMAAARQDPFWQDPQDPHISGAAKTILTGKTHLLNSARNPAYSALVNENVWGVALKRILVDGVSIEEATKEAIARIEEIFQAWQ